MIYRNENSKDKRFSLLPEDFNSLIKQNLLESIDLPIENLESNFLVKGRIYPEELLLRFSLIEKGRLKCHNFTGSIDYDKEAGDIIDRTQNIMEALASMMMEFLEEQGDIDMPLDWHEYSFDDRKIFLMYSTENDALEEEAKLLLGEEEAEAPDSTPEEFLGHDFFKEAEEKFKSNIH